jgi:hypothetical protein
MRVLTAVIVAFSLLAGCHRPDSWFVRKYENADPHDKAIIERKDRVLEIQCAGTTFGDGSKIPECAWLEQHVGEHLDDGDGFMQIRRVGDQVCYHDNIGGRECFMVVREEARNH